MPPISSENLGHFKVLAFDLDGTLAESKQPMSARIAGLLKKLIRFHEIAIISGADWPQFEKQVLPILGGVDARFSFYPTCGAKVYKAGYATDGREQPGWYERSGEAFELNQQQTRWIEEALENSISRWEHKPAGKIYGPQIENRGTQITFSALGQQAPPDVKKDWDPTFEKRKHLKNLLEFRLAADWGPSPLPFEIRMGGATSLDITLKGIDKGFAIRRIAGLGWGSRKEHEILFVGDALEEGDNDCAVKQTGCFWLQTSGVEETERILERILVST
mgnify:CR=1 FL=1